MSRFKNPGVIPQGMLAPAGMAEDPNVDPHVQSTTRPAGTLLRPSPGFDSVRVGKNRFQGKGPTGGFRQFEFAEDIGGSGAAMAITPGDTSTIEATEWLPESTDQLEPGSLIIVDRGATTSGATHLHEARHTIPDMGDRSPGRPLSRFLHNPAGMLREDYQENKVVTVLATVGIVVLAYIVGNDLEREYRSRRGGGLVSDTVAVPESGTAVAGGESENAVKKVSDAAQEAVDAVGKAAKDAVSVIEDTTTEATKTVKGAAE